MSNEKLGRDAAAALRAELGLGTGPIESLPRLIERKIGIGVAYVATTTPGHGMTMKLGDKVMMAVGCTEHPMRLRSTLAHELGHFRLGSVDRALNHSDWDERTPEEIQVDAFARHLLVPLDTVRAAAQGATPTLALLSNLVQTLMASPNIVAIQLRDAKVINAETCREWSSLSAGRLASQFGWSAEYAALAAHSKTPRAPQSLLARAVEAYRWGLVTPASIARLDGKHSARLVVEQLAAEGIFPDTVEDALLERPPIAGSPLTAEEIELLSGGVD